MLSVEREGGCSAPQTTESTSSESAQLDRDREPHIGDGISVIPLDACDQSDII
jgi:hypothetical protein